MWIASQHGKQVSQVQILWAPDHVHQIPGRALRRAEGLSMAKDEVSGTNSKVAERHQALSYCCGASWNFLLIFWICNHLQQKFVLPFSVSALPRLELKGGGLQVLRKPHTSGFLEMNLSVAKKPLLQWISKAWCNPPKRTQGAFFRGLAVNHRSFFCPWDKLREEIYNNHGSEE